jgi:hypothetical protein
MIFGYNGNIPFFIVIKPEKLNCAFSYVNDKLLFFKIGQVESAFGSRPDKNGNLIFGRHIVRNYRKLGACHLLQMTLELHSGETRDHCAIRRDDYLRKRPTVLCQQQLVAGQKIELKRRAGGARKQSRQNHNRPFYRPRSHNHLPRGENKTGEKDIEGKIK